MDSPNPFHSLRLLALSLYASDRKVDTLPKLTEISPWERCEIVPMPIIRGAAALSVPSHLGEFL